MMLIDSKCKYYQPEDFKMLKIYCGPDGNTHFIGSDRAMLATVQQEHFGTVLRTLDGLILKLPKQRYSLASRPEEFLKDAEKCLRKLITF